DIERHTANRAENRVDRHLPDGQAAPLLSRRIAATGLDVQLHLDPGLVIVHAEQVQIRVLDLHFRRTDQVGGGHHTGTLNVQAAAGRLNTVMQPHTELLDVQNELCHVLTHARDGRELVRDIGYAHRRNRSAWQR